MSRKKRKLGENLGFGENILLLSERIKKNSARENFTKPQFKILCILTKKRSLLYRTKKVYRWKDILLAH